VIPIPILLACVFFPVGLLSQWGMAERGYDMTIITAGAVVFVGSLAYAGVTRFVLRLHTVALGSAPKHSLRQTLLWAAAYGFLAGASVAQVSVYWGA